MKNILLLLLISITITACGTTSGLQDTASNSEQTSNNSENNSEKATQKTFNFSQYNSVVIEQFSDKTEKGNIPSAAKKNFANLIESYVRDTGAFEKVTQNPEEVTGNTLVITGDITRYAKGNTALKALVGLGAGSTYFDATVRVEDLTTQKQLGEIIVDRNSWALGGVIAATQTVEQFMNEAADKVGKELAKAKTGE